MDTVEGVKGGKVLLTLMFMPYSFMAAFLLPVKTSALVTEAFATIRRRLAEIFGDAGWLELFARLFPVILTDIRKTGMPRAKGKRALFSGFRGKSRNRNGRPDQARRTGGARAMWRASSPRSRGHESSACRIHEGFGAGC